MFDDAPTINRPLAEKIDQLAAAAQPLTEFGRYEVLGEIARGGVGIIYKARQRGLERIVALKVLQSGTTSPEHVQRFLQEAQAAAKLQHPNIVPIHDFGMQDGLYFFTMDFIEGETLAERIARGPLTVREALEIVRDAARALHYAHEHGVVHRDIKPSNILLDKEGRVRITDFGIAKEAGREEKQQLTITGQVMGTPRYMSPEQASGHTAKADRRSDVFSLGVTLYEMLTGVAAFDSDEVFSTLKKVTDEDPPPPHKLNRKVHRDASTICQKAMEKAPERRYQTAQEMAEDIERFLAGEPIQARPVSGLVRAGRRLHKHWKLVAVNVLILSVVGYVVKYYADFYLASRPSHLRLELQPAHAQVVVDDMAIRPADLQNGLSLKPGRHRLLAGLEPDYEPKDLAFETKPAERLFLPVLLTRRTGRLEVLTDPPDAAVTILTPTGGRMPFRGPRVEQELPTGPYVVFVYRENYLAQQLEVPIEPRQTRQLRVVLPPITVWAVPTSGQVRSVPAVADLNGDGWDDTVVGDDDGNIYCLSGQNGGVLWLFKAQEAVQAPIALAEINDDEVPDVLAGSTDGRLYCLDGRHGTLLWAFATGGAILGPPRLKDVNGDGTLDVFIGSADGFVYGLSGADGKLLWKFRTNGRVESALAWQKVPNGHHLLVGSADKTLYALDPAAGSLVWSVPTPSPLLLPMRLEDAERNGRWIALLPTPQSPDDVLTHTAVSLELHQVIGVSDSFPLRLDLRGDGKPLRVFVSPRGTECYEPDSTNLLWRTDYRAVAPHGADINGDGVLDLIFNNGPDEIIALDGTNAKLLGQIKLDEVTGRGYSLEDVDHDGVPDVTVGAGRKVYCFSWVGGRKKWLAKSDAYYDVPLAVAGRVLIAKNQAGLIAAYTPESPQPVWKFATSPQPSPYNGVATEAGLVADADPHTRILRVLSADTGTELWKIKFPGDADQPIGWPALADGHLVVGDGLERLYCLAATNGTTLWSIPLPKVTIAPAVGKDFVCVADGEGTLHAIGRKDGRPRWQFRLPAGGWWWSQPTLTDVNGDQVEDVIAVNGSGYTCAVNGSDGKLLWLFQHAKELHRTRNRVVLFGRGSGLIGTADGVLFCLNLANGQPLWSSALREPLYGEPVVSDLTGDGVPEIVLGTMRRRVHCLDGRNRALQWSFEVGAQIRYSTPQIMDGKFVLVATGPPENGLYCLRSDCPRRGGPAWFGPWRSLSLTK